jgi:CubicO group peptidase (beta-lactamase class C family)
MGAGLGQGLGWTTLQKGQDPDTRLLMHNGGTGGFSSYFACIPQQAVRVVVLANSRRSVDKVGWDLLRAMRDGTAVDGVRTHRLHE